ncbi:hypothetical protein [Streptomyces sp. NPDC047097]|uniref:hypothetical protein n=1 Tax=Streptomyces sp. NPDC047097 TaxID=3155260 RepID=UPI0034047066
MSERIEFTVDRDGWTTGLQLNIAQLDENNRGWGYRLAGPKYNGSSKNLLTAILTERDAEEIRAKLNAVFPPQPVLTAPQRQFLTFALELAADVMASRAEEFDSDDRDALAFFERMAAGTERGEGQ